MTKRITKAIINEIGGTFVVEIFDTNEYREFSTLNEEQEFCNHFGYKIVGQPLPRITMNNIAK